MCNALMHFYSFLLKRFLFIFIEIFNVERAIFYISTVIIEFSFALNVFHVSVRKINAFYFLQACRFKKNKPIHNSFDA